MSERRPARPGGMPPPTEVALPDGTPVSLVALAERVAELHLRRHPEDVERYGQELAHDWCVHDHQHMLAWAIADLDLERQVLWLAGVLHARGYPVPNLTDSLLTAAGVIDEDIGGEPAAVISARLRTTADTLAARYP